MNIILQIAILVMFTSFVKAELLSIEPENDFIPHISTTTQRNSSDGLYTYSIEITNDSSSRQSISSLLIDFSGIYEPRNMSTLVGWDIFFNDVSKKLNTFAIDISISDVIVNADGSMEISSELFISPGETVCCVTFSAYAPPQEGLIYLLGYTKPIMVSGGSEVDYEVPEGVYTLENRAFNYTENIPTSQPYLGNGKPAGNDLIAVTNFWSPRSETFEDEVLILVGFGLGGQQLGNINGDYSIEINGQMVPSALHRTWQGPEALKYLQLRVDGSTALVYGKNTLTVNYEKYGTKGLPKDTDTYIFNLNNTQ